MNKIWGRFLGLLLSAVFVSLLLHTGSLIRHFEDPPGKAGALISGPRTDVGDNYYYFTLLRHAPERLASAVFRHPDPDGGDHRNINAVSDAYAIALYAGHGLFRLADAIAASSREAVLLTSIFNAAVLAYCFALFLTALQGEAATAGTRWFFVLAWTFAGLVFVDAFGNSLYLGRPYWDSSLLTYYSNPLRLINPPLFWAAGLAAATLIVRWLREERTMDFIGAAVMTGLTGLFSISVGATLLLALGLTMLFEMVINRIMRPRLFVIVLAAFAGLAWSYLQLRAYASTPLGQELRHGEFVGVVPKWQFLVLFLPIPFIWRIFGKERTFVAALVASAALIGLFCESFHLGSRLWVRGAVVYAWAVTLFVVGHVLLGLLRHGSYVRIGRHVLRLAMLLLLVVLVYQVQRPVSGAWNGFIKKEKWEMYSWVDKHLPRGSVIASADIEDAFLLPIYTHSKPLYAMYGVTSRSRDDELKRYFYTMRLFGRDRLMLDAILRLRQNDVARYVRYVMGSVSFPVSGEVGDAIIFLELVLYHSYVRDFSNALTDRAQHALMADLLARRAEEAAQLTYSYDFVIVDNSMPLPTQLAAFPVVFRNDRYSVLSAASVTKPHQ